jgi:hypothetical protein
MPNIKPNLTQPKLTQLYRILPEAITGKIKSREWQDRLYKFGTAL